MLDVVFIMLIFFIVTATFIKEAGIDVDKPEAATAVVQEKASILIAIDAERPGYGSTGGRSISARCAPSSNACTRRTPRAPW
jgi:biopolymer transport protein ExbD